MIIGWYNYLDGKTYDIGSSGMDSVIPKGVLGGFVEAEEGDKRHEGTKLSVTCGLGCVRRTLIERALEVKPDPMKNWAREAGSWLHEKAGRKVAGEKSAVGRPVWYTEVFEEDKCSFKGQLWGLECSGLADGVRRDVWHPELAGDAPFDGKGAMYDFKFSLGGADYFAKVGGEAKPEYAAQMNMLRVLMEQTLGRGLEEMEMKVWVVGKTWKPTYAPLMNLDRVGAVKVGGSDYVVRELFEDCARAFEGWMKIAEVEYGGDIWEVPLEKRKEICAGLKKYGETLWRNKRGGNACTDYCSVKKDCDNLDGGI